LFVGQDILLTLPLIEIGGQKDTGIIFANGVCAYSYPSFKMIADD
jgi:hypothetical protein